MARRRVKLATYKTGIQHADSILSNVGEASTVGNFTVLDTSAGARDLTGGSITIKSSATTARVVNVGDIIKYVNLFIQCGPRADQGTDQDRTGWLEWAFVCVKESETQVPVTDLGILTIGTICTNMFRNECIYTGNIPVGGTQPNSASIVIKIPKFK